MKLLDINEREISIGNNIARIYYNRTRPRSLELHQGTVVKICVKLIKSRWGPTKGQSRIITSIGIEGKHPKYNHTHLVTCYNTKRLGVLTGDYGEDSQTLEKLSRVDDKPQA